MKRLAAYAVRAVVLGWIPVVAADVDNDWEAEGMVATVPGPSDFDAKLAAFLRG